MLLKAGTQYAIRNTQYANPVKLYCVIRKRLPQYAIAQNAAYGVPLISRNKKVWIWTMYTVRERPSEVAPSVKPQSPYEKRMQITTYEYSPYSNMVLW